MPTDYRRPVDDASLAHNFRVFAEAECAAESLYAALSLGCADDAATLALLMRAPYPQRRPVLLFAAVHDLLLEGHSHELARFYRSVTGDDDLRTDVENAAGVFFDFCRDHRGPIADLFAERTVQTNEVGRSAGLRLALATLPSDAPIALIDIGCSAGLNLFVDRFRFEFRHADGSRSIVGPESDVAIATDIVSGWPPCDEPAPPIVARHGVDRSPLDVHDPRDARWLRACVWPSDRERHRRLAAAIGLARSNRLDVKRADAVEGLASVLASLDRSIRPVVFHSWVVSYFDGETRRRFVDDVRAMLAERDGAWVSAEGPGVVPGLAAPPLPPDADATLREATVWHVTTRNGGGAVARSHPHGRWIAWLDR